MALLIITKKTFYTKIVTYDKIKFPQANSMVGAEGVPAYDFFFANQTENDINFNPTSTKIVDIRQNRTNLTMYQTLCKVSQLC